MASTAQYASIAVIGAGKTTTADTSYTAPTTATVGVIAAATTTDLRIDNIDSVCEGTSVAGLHRLWLCEGEPSPTIQSITSATTTATCTTSSAHNLITGDLITLRDAFPVAYNVTNASVTVTSSTSFTFAITSTGSIPARDVGAYSSTNVAPIYHLFKETAIAAITGNATTQAFNYSLSSFTNQNFLPIVLPAGWSLRSTVSATQTNAIKTTARGGKM
ncbi:MAG: hypothetical protein WBI40_07545 [Methylococcaceae bacterium]